MGCYGLGLSRILAASVEVMSTEKELRWPDAIVPFTVCIVCPKEGSNEAKAVGSAHLDLYDDLVDELNLVIFFYHAIGRVPSTKNKLLRFLVKNIEGAKAYLSMRKAPKLDVEPTASALALFSI